MAKFQVHRLIATTLQRWAILLSKGLSFGDNFEGYEWEGSIPAGFEKRISHDIGQIPTRFLVLYADNVNTIVRSPTTPASKDFFYVKNTASTSTFKGKIIILP